MDWLDNDLNDMLESALDQQWRSLNALVADALGQVPVGTSPGLPAEVRGRLDSYAQKLAGGHAKRDPRYPVLLDCALRMTGMGYLTVFPQYQPYEVPPALFAWIDRRGRELQTSVQAFRSLQLLVVYRRFMELPRLMREASGQPGFKRILAEKVDALSVQTGCDISAAVSDPDRLEEVLETLAGELEQFGHHVERLNLKQLDAELDRVERDARHLMELAHLSGRLPGPYLRAERRRVIADWPAVAAE